MPTMRKLCRDLWVYFATLVNVSLFDCDILITPNILIGGDTKLEFSTATVKT